VIANMLDRAGCDEGYRRELGEVGCEGSGASFGEFECDDVLLNFW